MLKKILLIVLIVLVLSQFIQPPKNNGALATPTDITHVVPVPDTVMALLKVACYDCHSNNTRYPWYNNITPVNWWLRHHVNEGKRELNFSDFANGTFKRKMHKLDETGEQIEKHEMPISSYLWIHKDARLGDAQRKLLIDWAKSSKEKVLQDSLQAASAQ